jgi:phospholipase/carboxylesterase
MSIEINHRFIPGRLPVTLLLLHGEGGDENDLIPVGRALLPGAAILSPRIEGDATGIAEWIPGAAKQYGIDAAMIYVLWYAGGADIAVATMLQRPGIIAGGVLLRPRFLAETADGPDLAGAPILIVAGEQDRMAPARDAERLAMLLSQAGAAVDFALQEAGHDLTPQDFAMGKEWFAQLAATRA